MKQTLFTISVILIAFSGCAKRADSVVPVAIPIVAYSGMECEALAAELHSERDKLAILIKQQNHAATADAVGVFLIGVPTGSLVGADKEGELAVSKGKVLSIENAIKSKDCQ